MKRIAILGSTGSIGRSALSLVDLYPDCLEVVALAAGRNTALLVEQCRRYRPKIVAVADPSAASDIRDLIPGIKVVDSESGLVEVACHPDSDQLVSAVTGASGLLPTYRAVDQGKPVALANKEAMVMAGELLIPLARKRASEIIPVDSEHSALHQCLRGATAGSVRRLILTASGGPFLNRTLEQLQKVTVGEALNHPTWAMGRKITIDSATMMNKGLEVIEAHHFFGMSPEQISVVVHPQSTIHSIVEFIDGTMLAQMGITDMRSCLLYAFAYPGRWESRLPDLDLTRLKALTFHAPVTAQFRCLDLAYQALQTGGTCPTALNAANEVAVELFLKDELSFLDIPVVIQRTLDAHRVKPASDLPTIMEADRECRRIAQHCAAGISRP